MYKTEILNWLKKTDIPLTTISKKSGISRSTLYNWINGSPVRGRNLSKLIDAYNKEIKILGNMNIEIEDDSMNVGQLIDSQQRTIELQDEKIIAQQDAISTLEIGVTTNPIERSIWDELDADLELKVMVKINIKKLSLSKKYTSYTSLEGLSNFIGYSVKELTDIYSIGKWHDDVVGKSSEKLYSKGTITRLQNMSNLVVKSVEIFKIIVGERYIPIPITFITKNGEKKHAMSYNKLNILSMEGHAKIVFINGKDS